MLKVAAEYLWEIVSNIKTSPLLTLYLAVRYIQYCYQLWNFPGCSRKVCQCVDFFRLFAMLMYSLSSIQWCLGCKSLRTGVTTNICLGGLGIRARSRSRHGHTVTDSIKHTHGGTRTICLTGRLLAGDSEYAWASKRALRFLASVAQ